MSGRRESWRIGSEETVAPLDAKIQKAKPGMVRSESGARRGCAGKWNQEAGMVNNKAVIFAKTEDVEVLNLKVIWLAESRMMKADFKDSNGGPFGSYERKIDEPSLYSLVAFVREAVDEYIELRLKSLNAILMK